MKTTLLLLLSFYAHSAFCQIKIDSIFIYKQIAYAGSTANLHGNHKRLASERAENWKLTKEEIIELNNIFQGTKKQRYFQQKHGGEIYLAVTWSNGEKSRCIIEGNNNIARMVNLDTMRRWVINDSERVKRLYEMIK